MPPPRKTTKKKANSKKEFSPAARIAAMRRDLKKSIPGMEIIQPGDHTDVYHEKIPSGIREVDKLLGGYAKGIHIVIHAPPNVGKDMLINRMISAVQKENKENTAVMLIYGETWDKGFARMNGVQAAFSPLEIRSMEEMMPSIPEALRRQLTSFITESELEAAILEGKFTSAQKKKLTKDLGKILLSTPANLEEAMDVCLKVAKAGVFQAVVVNSLDSLAVKTEVEAVGKDGIRSFLKGRGGEGKGLLLSAFFRNIGNVMNQPIDTGDGPEARKTTFFWITQWRDGKDHMSGGNALKHNSGYTIELRRVYGEGTHTGAKDPYASTHRPTSDLIGFTIKKGKYGIPDGLHTRYRYYKSDHVEDGKILFKAGEIDTVSAVRSEAVHADIIKLRGGGYDIFLAEEGEEFDSDGFFEAMKPLFIQTEFGPLTEEEKAAGKLAKIAVTPTERGLYIRCGRNLIDRFLQDFPNITKRIEEMLGNDGESEGSEEVV